MEQPAPNDIENGCVSEEPDRKRKLVVDDKDNIDSLMYHLQGAMEKTLGAREGRNQRQKTNQELVGKVDRLEEKIETLEQQIIDMQKLFCTINFVSAQYIPENVQKSFIAGINNLLQQSADTVNNDSSTEHPTDLDSATQQ